MTSIKKSEISEDLLSLAGFTVSNDVDQPGMYVWHRYEGGKIVESCDSSYNTEEQAKDAIRTHIANLLLVEHDISHDEWVQMLAEQRKVVMMQLFR